MSTYFPIHLILLFFCLNGTLIAQEKYPAVLTVAQDGSGDYKTIQDAVNSVRDLGKMEVRIMIKKGIYREKLIIPSWKTNVTLVGEDEASTVITNADYSGKRSPNDLDQYRLGKVNTFTSYTVLVQGDNFRAEHLTIENASGRVGQAVALHVEADRAVFKNCRLLGNQDTLYAATSSSRQYYQNCYIEGTTDFIFGEATAVFQSCIIKSLQNSYITAAATTVGQEFGFVFLDCRLISDPVINKVFLGRPWRPFAKTVFIRTEMDGHIAAEGWQAWPGDPMFPNKEKTAYYAEYESRGSGANPKGRAGWSKQLNSRELKKYTIANIFNGNTPWLPKIQ